MTCSNGKADVEEPAAVPATLQLAKPRPNPTTRTCAIAYAVPASKAGQKVEVVVYDVAGRRVKTLARGSGQPGWTRFSWDLTDDRGRRVATGTYFVKAALGEQKRVERLVVGGR